MEYLGEFEGTCEKITSGCEKLTQEKLFDEKTELKKCH
jgi:hypothetical protein